MTEETRRNATAETEGKDPVKTETASAAEQPPEAAKAAEQQKRRRRRRRALRSFLFRTISLALVLYILLFHIVGVTVMPSRDMHPRLDAGDLLLYYRLEKNYKSQDIVVIDKEMEEDRRSGDRGFIRAAMDFLKIPDPEAPETKRFVCRVIAAPGDTVEITDEGLRINGNIQAESNIYYPTRPYEEGKAEYPLKLKDGEYFVLADQRNGGMDSRYFGIVKAGEIQGVVITILRRSNL